MSTRVSLVCTSIGKGEFLDGYCREIKKLMCPESIEVIVIPDEKSPAALHHACWKKHTEGINIVCPTLDQQDGILQTIGMKGLVPRNSDNRRNVGYLMALIHHSDVIISIDDDNFLIEGTDFFGEHSKVGHHCNIPERTALSDWYNVCGDLGMPGVYPRGFPYFNRGQYTEGKQGHTATVKSGVVAVNQGLWTGEPDLDAGTWLQRPTLRVEATKRVKPFLIGEATWLPINSQNTAVTNRAMMAYYFIPMTSWMDRLGDIFQGFFLEACVKQSSQTIRVGTPMVDHRRNSHNYLNDSIKEGPGIKILEELLPYLREVKLQATGYDWCYLSLADALEEFVEAKQWEMGIRSYFHRVAFCMRKWVAACRMIG